MGNVDPRRTFEITHLDIIQLSKFYVHIINDYLDLSLDEFDYMCGGYSVDIIDFGETLMRMAQSFYDGTMINDDGTVNEDHQHHDLYEWQLKVVQALNQFEEKSNHSKFP